MNNDKADRPATLAAYLRQAREQAGLSARQLAREAGTTASNISRIESGETATPTPELLKRIADALDLDLAELFAYRGIILPRTASLDTYLRQEYHLSDEAVTEAEAAIKEIAAKHRKHHSRED
jgi:transcriptional regulator with XRE-family HTH domain